MSNVDQFFQEIQSFNDGHVPPNSRETVTDRCAEALEHLRQAAEALDGIRLAQGLAVGAADEISSARHLTATAGRALQGIIEAVAVDRDGERGTRPESAADRAGSLQERIQNAAKQNLARHGDGDELSHGQARR